MGISASIEGVAPTCPLSTKSYYQKFRLMPLPKGLEVEVVSSYKGILVYGFIREFWSTVSEGEWVCPTEAQLETGGVNEFELVLNQYPVASPCSRTALPLPSRDPGMAQFCIAADVQHIGVLVSED